MYEDYYRFSAKPFQLNPIAFFLRLQGTQRAMAYLDYGCAGPRLHRHHRRGRRRQDQLVRNLFRKLEAHNLVAAQLVSTQLDAEDTLRSVAASFGLEHEGPTKSALLKNLEDFLGAASRQGKRALLVVDEAQNLTPRAVEERPCCPISEITSARGSNLLLGQPSFAASCRAPTCSSCATRGRLVPPWTARLPTRPGYIVHRLRTVGGAGNPGFDDAALLRLHRGVRRHYAPPQHHLRRLAAVRLPRGEGPFREAESTR